MNDRDTTIAAIRSNLKRRSGKAWSVTGGRGTAWGWIKIDAPPARCTWRHVLQVGADDRSENYVYTDTGKPDGHISPADRDELCALLSLDVVHFQGISIPSSSAYYQEYVDRSAGREPSKVGVQYWD